MNFFGHAVVASWHAAEPAFVLGAMLPDLANMLRTRAPTTLEQAINDGVELHHLTDRVFHDIPSFRRLARDAFAQLSALGVRRGSARAVAHVGTELLIDSLLSTDDRAVGCYHAALRWGRDQALAPTLNWTQAGDADRFEDLCNILLERGVNPALAEPHALTRRLSGALAGRTRLRLMPADIPRVEIWARSARERVARVIDQLVAELQLGLPHAAVG